MLNSLSARTSRCGSQVAGMRRSVFSQARRHITGRSRPFFATSPSQFNVFEAATKIGSNVDVMTTATNQVNRRGFCTPLSPLDAKPEAKDPEGSVEEAHASSEKSHDPHQTTTSGETKDDRVRFDVKDLKNANAAEAVEGESFKSLGVPSYLCSKMEAAQLRRPTLIQCAAIPQLLIQKHNPLRKEVKDLIVSDMTGSGKTLAYVLPIIANTNNFSEKLQHVIVVPSRELSVQVAKVVQNLCKGGSKRRKKNPVRCLRLAGVNNDAALDTVLREAPHILIGTPQILSYVLCVNKDVDITRLTHVVLDEVDQLISLPDSRKACLDLIAMGTRHKINPQERKNSDHDTSAETQRRQLVFVSATITDEVLRLAKSTMPRFLRVTPKANETEWQRRKSNFRISGKEGVSSVTSPDSPDAKTTAPKTSPHTHEGEGPDPEDDGVPLIPAHLRHYVVVSKVSDLAGMCAFAGTVIKGIIRDSPERKAGVLAFLRSRHQVESVVGYLRLAKLKVEGIHQSSSRQERSRAFRLMAEGNLDVLVGTDMLARGLDIAGVSDVLNIGVPRSTNIYVHRAGRAGRLMGRNAHYSRVVTVASEDDVATVLAYEKALGIPIQVSHLRGKRLRRVPEHEYHELVTQAKKDGGMPDVAPPLTDPLPDFTPGSGGQSSSANAKRRIEMRRRRKLGK